MTITVQTMYDYLIDNGIATKDEIDLVTAINGNRKETYEDILFVRTRWLNFDFLNKEDE